METLGKDVLTLIALEMDYPDILKFCSSSSKIQKAVCKNKNFWRNKLYKTYPDLKYWQFNNYKKSYKDIEMINELISKKRANNESDQRGIYIREELINFLRYSNFGVFPGTEIPLNYLFFPLLNLKIFNLDFLFILFRIYFKINNLTFLENGKKYYKSGSDMEKYLGKYLDDLEERDSKREENLIKTPRFDRNKFSYNYNRFSSIISQGLNPFHPQKELLSSLETISLISNIDQVFRDLRLT